MQQSENENVAAPVAGPSSPVQLHDELKQSFSGDTLSNLEHLGVTAYSTSDVEQRVIARALQDEAASRAKHKDKQTQQPRGEGASESLSSLKRKRIPKKTGVDFSSLSSVSLPVPVSVVHEDDPTTAAGTLAKQRLEDALNITSKTNRPAGPSNTRAYSASSSLSSSFVDDELPSARTQRQRLIETGEVTPFHAVAGAEKTYRRVNTITKPTTPTSISTSRTNREIASTANKTKPFRATTPTEQNRRKITPQPGASKRKNKPPITRTSRTPSPSPSATSPATSTSRSASSTQSPLSVSELPARLTRAQIRSQVNAIDAAVRREQGIKEEKKEPEELGKRVYVELNDDDDDEDLSEAAEEKVDEDSAMPDADVDEEWKGDEESSGDDAEWNLNTSRHSSGRRDLAKAEREEVAEIEEEEEFVADDDEDDGDGDDDDGIDNDDEMGVSGSASRHRRHVLIIDDFLDDDYEERVAAYRESKMFANEVARVEGREPLSADSTETESLDVAFDGGFVLPGRIWDRLFGYQKTAIKWLWELHCQNTGGIIADEMGLGKTIQMVAFLAGLHYSRALLRASANSASSSHTSSASSSSSSSTASTILSLPPSLILCPATIMTQWLREFHSWYPELRILVLHDSVQAHHGQSKEMVVDKLFRHADVLITTYECARLYRHLLLHREWGYVTLDEGHKIRNPDAAITLTSKQFLSIHRIILTGAPIQNNLIELWSLFDFVFPGKLGTLPVFEDEFCFPINQGGYVNASTMQVQLAYRCATVLRDLIHPYILRRSKADVAQHLPKKTEQVLFVSLSPEQRQVYKEYLASEEVQNTIDGRGSLFKAIHTLRKICNHPDLVHLKSAGPLTTKKVEPRDIPDYGAVERSGKMQVVEQILHVWRKEGHRVLLFTQTRQMLDIIESFVSSAGYSYRRIDGLTSIKSRLPMIDEFNSDPSLFLFLLTTKAGGLGVNLTGANRVLLYDPDWNPSTDLQARERSWRIGQRKTVTVYRLVVRGTIEEKIYHRQIFKQFLTNKILTDPKQKRFFSRRDMKDLFSLEETQGTEGRGGSETARVFRGVAEEVYKETHREQQEEGLEEEQLKEEEAREDRTGFKVEEEEAEYGSAGVSAGPASRKRLRRVLDQPTSTTATDLKLDVRPFHSDYAAGSDSNSASQSSSSPNMLSLLFSHGNVQSVMNHDSILEGSTQSERSIAESVAKRVAAKAIAALKKSRQEMKDQPLSAPTWTGRSGYMPASQLVQQQQKQRFGNVSRMGLSASAVSAAVTSAGIGGAVEEKGRMTRTYESASTSGDPSLYDHRGNTSASSATIPAGVNAHVPQSSSAALLAALSKHHQRGLRTSASGMPNAHSINNIEDRDAESILTPHLSLLLSDLHTYLTQQSDDGATTQQIIALFGNRLRNDQEKYVFRQLLREIADLEPGEQTSGGKKQAGKWFLKKDKV